MTPKHDWPSVDWSMSNQEIAARLGSTVNTVASMRYKLRVGRGKRAQRKDKEQQAARFRTPEMREKSRAAQPNATAAAKRSQLSGRGVDNVHAKDWILQSPDDKLYSFRNLYEFVRTHTHLFAARDVVWKRQGGVRGTGGEWCNATTGINGIKSGSAKTWKGWRLLFKKAGKKNRRWKATEDELIREKYLKESVSWISKKLDRTEASVKARASIIGAAKKQPHKTWTEDEDNIVLKNYHTHGAKILGEQLGRSALVVRARAKVLGVVNYEFKWNVNDLKYLTENYGKLPVEEIAAKVYRTIQSVYFKAFDLGLTKKHKNHDYEY